MTQPLPADARSFGPVAAGRDPGEPVEPVDPLVGDAAARLERLARRWRRRRAVASAIAALGVGLPLAAAALRWATGSERLPLALVALLAPVIVATWASLRRPADPPAIAFHLDRRVPALAESGNLLLAMGAVPALQRLQRRRAAVALLAPEETELVRLLPWRLLRRALAVALAGAALGLLLLRLPRPARATEVRATAPALAPTAPPPTLLRQVTVKVRPPAYTRHGARSARGLGVAAEEGATVTWRVEAEPTVGAATLLFDESERAVMRRLPCAAAACFSARFTAREPRLLRLLLESETGERWRSAPARLELLPDAPPSIELLAPPTLVERPPERPGTLPIAAAVADDYAVTRAELVVTIASGGGEQVTFQDRRLPIPVRAVAARQVVRRNVDLVELGFAAESELYLRVEIGDGPGRHVTRSPTIVVRPAGERIASAPLGEGLPMIAPPEVFRSQRQIVIDTQKLIADAPRLAAGEVLRRSRAIGFDQRALRLRYGTLLGQETLEGRHEEEDQTTFREQAEQFGVGGVPEELSHAHDSSESATFFTEPVRRKLRGMLDAMWDAEGALATGAPRAALPHELRALGLLKEVQQADRVYVRRGSGEAAALDAARRLTGEVDEVRDLAERQATPPRPVVEAALAILAAIEPGSRSPRTVPSAELALLRVALAERARAGSAPALAALPALDVLASGSIPPAAARAELQRALWTLVPPPEAPIRRTEPAGTLWERYRARLGGSP